MHYFVFFFIFLTGAAMAIEEPEFIVDAKTDQYEIRKYGPILLAETKVKADFEDAGNQAFRILAAYIFGANKSKIKIAMTAPVSQQKGTSGFLVQFTMPKKYTLDTLPTPDDPRVVLWQQPSRKVAVYTYSGSWSESRYQKMLGNFRGVLEKDGVKTVGDPVLARYNSPFQLWFLRRNEIWLELKN